MGFVLYFIATISNEGTELPFLSK